MGNEDAKHWLMLSPFLILFFVFTILPVLSSVVLSFFDFDAVSFPRFAGLENYMRMFTSDDVFSSAVSNTLVIALVTGPIGFFLAFILAWMVNEFTPTIRTILAFLFYAPALTGNSFFVWKILFSGDSGGYINSWLISLGLTVEPIQFLKDPKYILTIVIIVQLWQSMGVTFLANIAGLQNANPELYEAGAIDGIRDRWHELWYITLPSMKSILMFGMVMQIQSAFSASAVAIQLVGFPSVNYSADTLVSHLMDVGTTRYEMGYAAAVSVFLFVLMAVTKQLMGKIVQMVGR